MKHTLLAGLAALMLLSTSVVAQERASPTCDWDLRGIGTPIYGKCPTEKGETAAPVVNIDKAAWEHSRQLYERISNEGGCSANYLPVELAAYCWNHALVRDANPNGPVGHSAGGDN